MPTYVYGCKEKHRREVVHRMSEDPEIVCEICGERMERIPQAVEHYHDPRRTLLEVMERKYINWRTRRKKGLIRG